MSIKSFSKLIGAAAAAAAAGLFALAGCEGGGGPVKPNQSPVVGDFDIRDTGVFAYDGTPKRVTVTAKEGKTAGAVTVKYNGSAAAPSDTGIYNVTFDVAAATGWEAVSGLTAGKLVIEYTVPAAADFDISGTGTFVYDGDPKYVTVTAKDGKTAGEITIKYNDSATAPSDTGTYRVTFDVAEAPGWSAVSGLSAGTLVIIEDGVELIPSAADFDIRDTGTFVYDGTPKRVTVTAKEGKTAGTVTVKYNGSETAPSDIGTYDVTFDVAAATGWSAVSGLSAGTLVIIEGGGNLVPSAGDFDISGTGTVVHDGTPKLVTVTAKEGKTAGAVTVKYNGSEAAPSDAGTYSVTFDVAAATGWEAVSGLSAGTLIIQKETSGDWHVDVGWVPQPACNERPADEGVDKSKPGLGRKNAVMVAYDGGSAEITFSDPNLSAVIKTDGTQGSHVVISNNIPDPVANPIDIILSGQTENGSFTLRGERTGLYLNGVSIKNPDGPAIANQGGRMTVNLVGGCDRKNYLEGRGVDVVGTDQKKGAFFSENSLYISGGGFLEVRSKYRHAIVADGNFSLDRVDLVISESASDGIHANEDIDLFKDAAGTLQILSVGDAIQSEREAVNVIGVSVYGGDIKARTTGVKSHGIAVERDILISGNPKIKIVTTGDASKGFRARRYVDISGGEIDIATTGNIVVAQPGDPNYDPTDTTSSAAGIRAREIDMSGGSFKSVNTGENSKGFNTDDHVKISGSNTTVDIRAHGDGIKADGNLTISAGSTVYSESSTKKGIDCKGTRTVAPGTTTEVPRP